MLEILSAPNSILSGKSVQIQTIDSNLLIFIDQMKKALESATDPIGVGLAAPQVGKNLQIFITKPTLKSKISVFINPKIIDSKTSAIKKPGARNKKLRKLEGCLSLPNIWGEVIRHPQITLEFMDEKGKKQVKTFKGFMAIIVQHETDHLEGILFTKRVLEQKGTLYQSEKDENGHDVFEEINI